MLVVSSSIPVLPELRTPDNDSACVEVPINMLAVAFNCPNIKVSSLANVPRPQAGELPRLSLRLKSTEVVPQLLAYMHTKDQRHLFDCLVPDWMYQVIRPVAPTSGNSGRHKRSASITTVLKAVKAMTMRKGHGRTLSGSSLQDELLDSLVDQQSADDNGGEPGSIRSRLVRACPEGVDLCEALDDVAKNLFALGSNLEELGYCEPGLDEELVILSRTILAEFVRNAKVSPE
ncbi:hypothetical protein OE88DRAFT_1656559 [Heliocybe sulcata]|uniref:Uncharacterized protein n=1 Tax=Heliocybe sulcata TaxID=5364 RepID=A0A5C3N7W8_9AGAM|nr:hypothetical protein OE88DRAFT_1656559 [Heliocybe sulcata]